MQYLLLLNTSHRMTWLTKRQLTVKINWHETLHKLFHRTVTILWIRFVVRFAFLLLCAFPIPTLNINGKKCEWSCHCHCDPPNQNIRNMSLGSERMSRVFKLAQKFNCFYLSGKFIACLRFLSTFLC